MSSKVFLRKPVQKISIEPINTTSSPINTPSSPIESNIQVETTSIPSSPIDIQPIDIQPIDSSKVSVTVDENQTFVETVMELLAKYVELDEDSIQPFMEGVNDVLTSSQPNTCKGITKLGKPCGQQGNFLNSHGYCYSHKSQDTEFSSLPQKITKTKPKATEKKYTYCCAIAASGANCRSTIGLNLVDEVPLCSTHSRSKNLKINQSLVEKYQESINA